MPKIFPQDVHHTGRTILQPGRELKSRRSVKRRQRCRKFALLDSAINTTDTLRILEAAPYFLERANVYHAADSFRQAVFDYNRYEYLMQGRVNANFYYIREQARPSANIVTSARPFPSQPNATAFRPPFSVGLVAAAVRASASPFAE